MRMKRVPSRTATRIQNGSRATGPGGLKMAAGTAGRSWDLRRWRWRRWRWRGGGGRANRPHQAQDRRQPRRTSIAFRLAAQLQPLWQGTRLQQPDLRRFASLQQRQRGDAAAAAPAFGHHSIPPGTATVSVARRNSSSRKRNASTLRARRSSSHSIQFS